MSDTNPNSRLEAFCDAVFAIAITLLIIDIKVPQIDTVHTKKEVWLAFAHNLPSLLAFLLSFIFILVSWVNHSHLFKLLNRTSQKFIYANGMLLLSIVLVPFTAAAVAEYLGSKNHSLAQPAITLYCAVALLNNISWVIMLYTCFYSESLLKPNIDIKKARRQSLYAWYGFVLYVSVFALSFWLPLTAFIIMASSFVGWLVQGITVNEERMAM